MKKNGKCKVFIVEDNLLYQQLIARQFDNFSYDVHCFTKGEACVEKTRSICPHIVVLDYHLEGNLNGLETLREIRAYDTSVFAVVYSTEKCLGTEVNYSLYGNFKYIEKTETSLRYFQTCLASL